MKRLEQLEAERIAPVAPAPNLALSKEVRLAAGRATTTGKAMGLKGNQLAMFVNKNVRALTGHDFMAIGGITHLDAPQPEPLLTPSDIALRLGIGRNAANPLLCDRGFQTMHRDHKHRPVYTPTERGLAAGAVVQDTGKRHSDGTPVRQVRWASGVVAELQSEMT